MRQQPRTVLGTIPELEVVDIPEPDICCGSAGIYNLVQPEPAEELGRRKVDNVLAVQPDAIATANPGCLLQIQRHLTKPVPMFHPIQLVDASIRGINPLNRRANTRAAHSMVPHGHGRIAPDTATATDNDRRQHSR